MIDPHQLQDYVVVPILHYLDPEIPFSDNAVKLLMGTAMQESECGTYIRQIAGPACGVWQMEPATFADHMAWLQTRSYLRAKVKELFNAGLGELKAADLMVGNLYLACAMARVHYWRVPQSLPISLPGWAAYWKRWYNTPLGAGTEEQFVSNYHRMGL